MKDNRTRDIKLTINKLYNQVLKARSIQVKLTPKHKEKLYVIINSLIREV